jgi:hypothetical protein
MTSIKTTFFSPPPHPSITNQTKPTPTPNQNPHPYPHPSPCHPSSVPASVVVNSQPNQCDATCARPSISRSATRYELITKVTTSNVLHGSGLTPPSVTSVAKETEAQLTLGLPIISIQGRMIPCFSLRIVPVTPVEGTTPDEPPPASSGGGSQLKKPQPQSTPAVRKMRSRETHLPPRLGEWPHLALADRMVGHQNQSSLTEGMATHQN